MKINQTDRPLLTISLLASRKDTIRKCLDSLSSLRGHVPSELIIVDTSQDEEMGRILSEYTDQVIPFTWCNDFAKARNIGIDAAKGEWFLYLDDDEWFIDTSEIEEFFLSGKYKKYTLAYYFQRNFTDRTGTYYHDEEVSRIFRLWHNVRFKGTIHEYPDPLIGESILLGNSAVEHYGYVYDTEQDRYNHAQRNILPLKEMIKQERQNARWWLQIIQEYRSIKQYDEMQKLCEEALEVLRDQDDSDTNIARGSFYIGSLYRHLKAQDYDSAEKALERALADKRNTRLCHAALSYYASILYFHNEDYDACMKYCNEYLRIYDTLDKTVKMYDEGFFFIADCLEQPKRQQIVCVLISCGVRMGDIRPLREYFWKLDWEDSRMFLEETFVKDVLDAFAKFPCASPHEEKEYAKMASAMMNRQGVDELIIKYLLDKETLERMSVGRAGQELILLGDADTGAFARLEKVFAQAESSHPYILHLKAMAAEDAQALGTLFEEALFQNWRQAADYICLYASGARCARLEVLLYQCDRKYAAYRDYFMMKEAEVRLFRNNKKEYGSLRRDIGDYGRKSRSFLGRYFKDSAFTGEMEMLPAQGRAAVLLGEALAAEDIGDVKAVSAALKSAVGVYPPFDEIIKAYTHLYAAEMKERLAYEAAAQDVSRETMEQTTDETAGGMGGNASDAGSVRNADGTGNGTGNTTPVGADGSADATQNAKSTGGAQPADSANSGMGGTQNVDSAADGGMGNTKNTGGAASAQPAASTISSAAISEEMRQLGEQVKSRIRILINQNMLAEAKQALGQLKALLPGDTELEDLEEEIRRRLS